ncbi:uncharacterized protein LOC131155665 isoform X2 [Malania oleifera]|uniref:uncharacterized protein LOC131155665 isoform X2 n=1 Tax=Malania oleifera TaxID=397392 RepID=UPI0025AE98B7|nr:uncharacterized protein LOC131155665 isoform X2 [Malania oleifera]
MKKKKKSSRNSTMQWPNSVWLSTVHPLMTNLSNSQAKASIPRTPIRIPSALYDYNDGNASGVTIPPPSHVKTITSPSNPFVKHCLKLRHSSSYRHFHGSALVVGTTPIREIYRFQDSMEERSTTIDCLLLLDKAKIPKFLNDFPVRIVHINSMVMKRLSGVQSSESIEAIALMRIPKSFHNVDDNQWEVDCQSWFPSPHRILVLDGIQGGAFLLPGCCDPFNEKALRASRGASFQLPIVSGDWTHLEALRNEFHMKMFAGHPDSNEDLRSVSCLSKGLSDSLTDTSLCLVLGSEGSGLSEKSRQVCELVSIPMAGEFESLNVSVAGGILLYMLQPQQQIYS